MTLPALALALVIGIGMGLLGGGGSIVAVPALTFAFGMAPKDAVLSSLVIVGLAAAAGAASGLARRVLRLRTAFLVAGPAIAGAAIGGAIGARLDDRAQLMILAATMLAAAVVMAWPPRREPADGPPATLILAITGACAGTLTGIVGVGGGFLLVPALVIFARLPMTEASATSLFVITLSAISAIPHYLGRTSLQWSFIAPVAALAAGGTIAGGMIAPRLPQRILQQAFAVTLVILGSYVLLRR